MKTGIIILNQQTTHNEYKIKRFFEEASALDISLTKAINDGTLAVINKDSSITINLPPCDFIIYLDKDIYLARLLEKAGYKLFNSADFIKLCDDKLLTYISITNLGVLMPKTYAGPLFHSPKLEDSNFLFLDKIIADLGFPMVVKRVYGSLGEGVFKIDNKKDLKTLYTKIAREPLLFQEYIPTSSGKSVRVLIIDKKVFGAFLRFNNEDFRSNFTSLSKGEEFNDSRFIELGQYLADKLQILYAGIDFLFGENGEPILCEINSNAFFEVFENTTHKNAAKAFLKMIKNNI